MSPQLISIYALVAMFVVATILPINMGVLAFVGAFLVGTLVAGQTTSAIIAGFPGGLFLTLVGITFLFAIAQNNGTIDWLVRLAVKAVRGRIAAIPWIMFGISAVLTSVGAVSPGAVAIIAPVALGFALKYSISPLLMGLMVIHGAQAGGFSPISIYGGITNRIVAKAGLPLSEITTFLASFGVNLAVAILLFFALGGRKLLQARAATPAAVNVPPVQIAMPQSGPQIFGDSEAEALSEEIALETGQKPNRSIMESPVDESDNVRRRSVPDRHAAWPRRSRGSRPCLQPRHRLCGDHHWPGPVPDGANSAEARDGPGRMARDHADYRREHLRGRAREDGHHLLRRRQRGGSGLPDARRTPPVLHRRRRLSLRVLDGCAWISHSARRSVPAGRNGRQPDRLHCRHGCLLDHR